MKPWKNRIMKFGLAMIDLLIAIFPYPFFKSLKNQFLEMTEFTTALDSGEMCSVCKQARIKKMVQKNGKKEYVCKKCYNKLLGEIRQNEAEERRRELKEKPVKLDVNYGTYSYGIFTPHGSDSAGGWDVVVDVTNRSSKDVKYVIAELIPYNTVGDIGYSETVGAGVKNIRITGPIYGGKKLKDQICKKFWYDIKLGRVGVGEVKVIFMDGTEKTFRQEE